MIRSRKPKHPRSPRAAQLAAASWLVATAFVAAGCPGTLDNPERFLDAGGCGDVPTAILEKKCATLGCHDAETKQSQLDLTAAGVGARIKNAPVVNENPSGAGGGGTTAASTATATGAGGAGGAGGASGGGGGAGGAGGATAATTGAGGAGGDEPPPIPDLCTTGVLADPASPEQSLVYTKTLPEPTCGSRMPLTGAGLTETERQCLLEWIASL